MKYFAASVCDYIQKQVERHQNKDSADKALLMMPSFPAQVIVAIGREMEARLPQVVDLIFKIAKPLWEEWQNSSLSLDQKAVEEARQKDWLDLQGTLTNYRNTPPSATMKPTVIILAGVDRVTDSSSLSDFHYCRASTIWDEELRNSFMSWTRKRLNEASLGYETETINHFDIVLKALLERVPADIIKISELLESLDLTGAQDGRDAEIVLLEGLQEFNLPPFTGYRFARNRNFAPYIDSATDFFTYDMFLEETARKKYGKAVDGYRSNPERQPNALSDLGQTGCYLSDDEFLNGLFLYMKTGNHEERKRLLTCDFTVIRDDILKYRSPRGPRPKRDTLKKLGNDPVESVLTALWITLRDFKKESEDRNLFAHEIIREVCIESRKFVHDCDGDDPASRQVNARQYLKSFFGGLDNWLKERIELKNPIYGDEDGNIVITSSLNKDDIDFQYSSIAEPRLEFSVSIVPDDDQLTIRRFALRLPVTSPFRIANELFKWGYFELTEAKGHFLPVFVVPNYEELMLAKDDEEAHRVLMDNVRSEDKQMVDILKLAINQALGAENPTFAESLKQLAFAYGNFIRDAAENGVYTALTEKWETLRQAYVNAFDVFLDANSESDVDHGALLLRAFLFIQKKDEAHEERWIWEKYEPSTAVTVLHPALLEMLHARIVYLFECFNAEANKQLRATGTRHFKDTTWDGYLSLAAIRMPLFGMLKDANRVFDTKMRGENLLHRIGEIESSEASLSTRLLLRYDAFEDEDISDAAMFRETRESLLLYRVMKDYWELHPHAKDGLSVAIYQNQDIQPFIAAVNKFISDDERISASAGASYFMTVTLFTESSDDAEIRRWVEQWKERWEAAEIQESLSHYQQCRLFVAHRIITPERNYEQFRKIIKDSLDADIVILSDFINAGEQGNEFFAVSSSHDVTSRPIKFPILEKTFCSIEGERHSQKRFRVLSNRQFRLAAKHSEVMARLKDMAQISHIVVLGCGDFTQWRGVIDDLHKNTEWVVCIDSSIDEQLLRENQDGNVREIIGFGSGVGSHGEANYTVSTEQFHFSDLQHKLKASIAEIFTGWTQDNYSHAAQAVIKQASALSGLSLIRATGIGQHIRDVMAYALTRKILTAKKGVLCDQVVSLDAFRHWFDGAETNMRPDLLWVIADITDAGRLHLDLRLIECKLAKRSDLHLDKAHQQIECGLQRLVHVFMPRRKGDVKERPDARYWWLQLHRLVASKSQIANSRRIRVLEALERMADGSYSVSWKAAAFTYWTDDTSDEIRPISPWDFRFEDQTLKIPPISIGNGAVRRLCAGKGVAKIPWDSSSLSFSSVPNVISETALNDNNENFPKETASKNSSPPRVHPDSSLSSGDEQQNETETKTNVLNTEANGNVLETVSMPKRIPLGASISGSRQVFWEFGHKELHNRHMLIFGSSGMGKTYAIQCLLNELGRAGQNSLVVDYTNGFLPNQLEPVTKTIVAPVQHIIRQSPLPISPFKLQTQIIGDDMFVPESHSTAAKRIAAIFKTVYDLGDQQFSVLFDAIMQGMQSYGDKFLLDNLLNIMHEFIEEKNHNNAVVNSTMSKLKPFILDKPFSAETGGIGWDDIFRDQAHRCHIFQLAGLDMHSWRLVTEFILWDLYAFVRSSGNKNTPKVVVLDEIQNLDHREECPLAKYLTEGRKFGLSLILATQSISNLATDQQSRLFQAGHKLFFKPAETEMGEYGKVLQNATGEPSRTWIERLSKLRKGECYSLGPSLGENDSLLHKAFSIRIAALEERGFND
jgi:DNA phosphorothioation-dependent restriction protein DptH